MEYLKRESQKPKEVFEDLEERVKDIINEVRSKGDQKIIELNEKFDGCSRENLRVSQEEIDQAYELVDQEFIEDIKKTSKNIEKFAVKQRDSIEEIQNYEVTDGVFLSQRLVPIENAGCYVPGGNYPLYSSALMLIIPAKVAGVDRVIACSPAIKDTDYINPKTLVAMDMAGADEIYVMGGAQAIAAFSYGTEQIAPVDIIVGPGNSFVTEAKRQCYGHVGIDFLAGPSEVLIIADKTANADYIAADILAQCEHDKEARGILITTDRKKGKEVIEKVQEQIEALETKEIAQESWDSNSQVIVVDSLDEAVEISNNLAPEHLEIQVEDEGYIIDKLRNYGSLFIGENSAEVFGDYASGTNHTLPTMEAAKYTGGVSVHTFRKILTGQKITKKGLDSIGELTYRMALGENLQGHANAAKVRLED